MLPDNAHNVLHDGRRRRSSLCDLLACFAMTSCAFFDERSSTASLTVPIPTPPLEIDSAHKTLPPSSNTGALFCALDNSEFLCDAVISNSYSLIMVQTWACIMKNALRCSAITSVRYGLISHTCWLYIRIGVGHTLCDNELYLWLGRCLCHEMSLSKQQACCSVRCHHMHPWIVASWCWYLQHVHGQQVHDVRETIKILTMCLCVCDGSGMFVGRD